jgi:hypothetical protein
MTIQTIKAGKERLIVLRERDYKALLRKAQQQEAQDAGDVAESRRRLKERGGRTLQEVRQRMGL